MPASISAREATLGRQNIDAFIPLPSRPLPVADPRSNLAAPHHHRRSRAGHGPAEIGRQLGVPHLAATALAMVIGVLAPAIGPDRTAVVRIVAKLADV